MPDQSAGALHALLVWLRDAFVWIVTSLAAGTLFAMRRKIVGFGAWVAVLFKSVIVGLLAVPVVAGTDLPPEWKTTIVASIAFGSDTLLILLDKFWETVARDPAGVGRSILRWLVGRGGIPPSGGARKGDS